MAEGTSGRSSDRFHLKWTLARKIGGLASLLVLLLLIVAVYNYRAMGNMAGEMSEVADADLPVTKLLTQLNTTSLQQHIIVERIMRLGVSSGDNVRAERESASAEFESAVEAVRCSDCDHQSRGGGRRRERRWNTSASATRCGRFRRSSRISSASRVRR